MHLNARLHAHPHTDKHTHTSTHTHTYTGLKNYSKCYRNGNMAKCNIQIEAVAKKTFFLPSKCDILVLIVSSVKMKIESKKKEKLRVNSPTDSLSQ